MTIAKINLHYILKNALWEGFQFLLVQINVLVSPQEKHQLPMSYSKQLMDYTMLMDYNMGYTKPLHQL